MLFFALLSLFFVILANIALPYSPYLYVFFLFAPALIVLGLVMRQYTWKENLAACTIGIILAASNTI